MDLIPSNEYVEFEDRVYNNPQVGIDETNTFIDQLRATQGQQNQQILSDTQSLGTDVPSNLGGLTGGESYFTSRYQTAPTVSATQNLRTAAQAAALNDVLANEQAIWKKRYQDAYRNYQKRQNNGNNPTTDATEGDVEEEETTDDTFNVKQDMKKYGTDTTIYDSTEQSFDNRSTERNKKIEVTKDSNGNVSTLTVNGIPHYGREARARYRYLKDSGLVR